MIQKLKLARFTQNFFSLIVFIQLPVSKFYNLNYLLFIVFLLQIFFLSDDKNFKKNNFTSYSLHYSAFCAMITVGTGVLWQ